MASTAGADQEEPTIRVGGVPEHFNRPWTLGKEEGLFDHVGANVEFCSIPEGTGEMMRQLQAGSIDVAVALTEGIVAAICKGASDVVLAGGYVDSPLRWGVSVGAHSDKTSLADLAGGKIGVSRMGSGSHLMSFLLAEREHWPVPGATAKTADASAATGAATGAGVEFVTLHNFMNLRKGVNSGAADAFLWEHFMTKPFVDDGELRFIGDIYTPWPCFMMAVRRSALEDAAFCRRFNAMAKAVRHGAASFLQDHTTAARDVAARFGLKLQDALAWLASVRYDSKPGQLSRQTLQQVLDTLLRVGVISSAVPVDALVDSRLCSLVDDSSADAAAAQAAVPMPPRPMLRRSASTSAYPGGSDAPGYTEWFDSKVQALDKVLAHLDSLSG